MRWAWAVLLAVAATRVWATPANLAALERDYGRFLPKEMARCTTCHLPSEVKAPESLDEFPHNAFGDRLRALGRELLGAGAKRDLTLRLRRLAREDADLDGVDNETELLLGHQPGDAADAPAPGRLGDGAKIRGEFAEFLASYRWRPFEPVERPPVPGVQESGSAENPIDAFLSFARNERRLTARPEASPEVLLRRVYLDLIGLAPTPAEQQAYLSDRSRDAYEKVVARLLEDPRHGERWGRHWMDIWRYSDWAGWSGGNQIRDSKPHIWRWRDWIVESLNQDKGYDRMIVEMLAADELAPEDPKALRATGYLVRNYKMLSREQWLEDTVKHTAQAFLGVTMGCAKCHDHRSDPISQAEYYRLRAVFEPHQVRTDRLPGQLDTSKDGLVRVYDTDTNATTYYFIRGDERRPDTNRVMEPGVPAALGGGLRVAPVKLPVHAAFPDKREFVIRDSLAASAKAVAEAEGKLSGLRKETAVDSAKLEELELRTALAAAKHESLLNSIEAEALEGAGQQTTDRWKAAAAAAGMAQRRADHFEARLQLHLARAEEAEAHRTHGETSKQLEAARASSDEPATTETADVVSQKLAAAQKAASEAGKRLESAKKKTGEAEMTLAAAEKTLESPSTAAYKPRAMESYPAVSTGRRLAFAQWVADPANPLTARVAMNHLWLRHFGQGIVPTPADFGGNGRVPSHPELLDWLAAEFVEQGWSLKAMHRLMVTSRAYRMASTPDEANARIDPDNVYLWRMNSRRMEAELVRDNVLYASGVLDPAMGGPEIDHQLGLTSRRRSLYLRIAAEKEVEFLKIFDGPAVTECYLRRPSVVPQQALALINSGLAQGEARRLAGALGTEAGDDEGAFVRAAFRRTLGRAPTPNEEETCREFLGGGSKGAGLERSRANLVLVLLNHNDFITIR